MIYLNPRGGLCNRLLVIEPVIQLGRKYRDSIIIFWRKCPELECAFGDLFEDIIYDSWGGTLSVESICCPQEELIKGIVERTGNKRIYMDTIGEIKRFQEDYMNAEGVGEFLLSSDYRYDSGFPHDFSWLSPRKAIRDKVEQIARHFGDYCIGIHIRRTDHLVAKKLSGDQLFVQVMNEEIERNPDVKFFLATDDIETKNFFMDKFGGRIVVNGNRTGGRQSKEGMETAVIDLFALAKTQKIYGSFSSTFSSMASIIGNVKLESVCRNLPPELKDKKIVLYGAGWLGQIVYAIYHKYCHIVGWIDQNDKEISKAICREILNPEMIMGLDYDYIIIAVISDKSRAEIKQTLLGMGIGLDKIIEDV